MRIKLLTLSLLVSTVFAGGGWYSCGIDGEDEQLTKEYPGQYLILAPKVFRPNLPYAVSVNLLKDIANGAGVLVRVVIRDSQNMTIAQAFGTDIKPGTPTTIKIDTIPAPVVPEEQYHLYVKGELPSQGTPLFENMEDIRSDSHSRSIFIQTDKGIYKPGETIRFRVVTIKPDLKPFEGTVDIKVEDSQRNIIKQYNKAAPEHGVISKEFTLSEEPPLGTWNIKARLSDDESQQHQVSISIEKYVLPKFEVKLGLPSIMTIEDELTVSLEAKYTYGKGVRGKGGITVEYPYYYSDEQREEHPPISETFALDDKGKGTVTFSNEELKRSKLINEYGWNTIKITGFATEALTDDTRNATAEQVTVYKQKEKIEIESAVESFKPGLEFVYKIVLKQQDDTPIPPDTDKTVIVKVTYNFPQVWIPGDGDEPGRNEGKEPIEEKQTIQLGEDGVKVMTVTAPVNCTSLSIEARYQNEESDVYSYHSPSAAKSPSNTFLSLIGDKQEVNAGESAKFSVIVTGGEVDKVTYQVIARGAVVLSEEVPLSGAKGEFSFDTTQLMSPKCRVVIYAVLPDQKHEILADAVNLNVKGLFLNDVSISVTPDKVQPFDKDGNKVEVEFKVKAKSGSFVGLSAVDQSVLLLAEGNDITQEDVEEEIAKYDTTNTYYGWYGPWRSRRKRSFWWPGIGGKDAYTILENSGMVALTDALLYRECQPPIMPMLKGPGGPGVPEAIAIDAGDAEAAGGDVSAKTPGGPAEVKVREDFPETWVWLTDVIGSSGDELVYKATVPHTITSWVASAFAIHDEFGLGVAKDNAKVQVFRPFFIRLNLPYSIKRGEKMALQILVFNYMENEQTVTVELTENDGFEFVKKGADAKKMSNVRKVSVPGGGGSSAVFYPIKAKIVGQLELQAKAWAQEATDGVKKYLKVEAEGVPLYFNKPLLLDMTESNSFEATVNMAPPANVEIVEGSEFAEFSVIGDIMGPILSNLDNLVRMPYGCGEQNMVGFVPNIAVRKYLAASGKATDALVAKTDKYMEAGYQRELQYKRNDHSFSAFGDSDETGSTWLTAFVVRSFMQAKPYIFIDDEVIENSVKFILSKQKENGEFEEHGEVHHKAMQGGASEGGVPLTAYVYTSLLEAGRSNDEAKNYLERSLEAVKDKPYSLSIVAYALNLANSSKAAEALQMLEAKAIVDGGLMHWEETVGGNKPENETRSWYWDQPRPVDVETSSYGLKTFLRNGRISEATPIIRWLSSQRNEQGGWTSTQDTVVGIDALADFAAKVSTGGPIEMTVDVAQGDVNFENKVNQENQIVLQKNRLGKSLSDAVQVKAKGRGLGYAQVAWHYNIPKLDEEKPFICTQTVDEGSPDKFSTQICCKYALEGRSNMAVVQLKTPSGFKIEKETLDQLPASVRDLQRVETAKEDTEASIYFTAFDDNTNCLNVTGERFFTVTDMKPSTVKVFDYYEPKNEVYFSYKTDKEVSLEERCPDCWDEATIQAGNLVGSSGRRCPPSLLSLPLVLLLLLR